MVGKYFAATIDLGSNMLRLALGARRKPGYPLDFHKEVEVSRIAEGLAGTGRLARAPVERTARALLRFREVAERAGVSSLTAVATGALRQARNRVAVLEELERVSGVSVEVISAEREAELTARGIRTALGDDRSISVIDVGGASTEIVIERQGERFARSFEIGVITLTERCLAAGLHGRAAESFLREAAAAAILPLEAVLAAAPPTCFASGGAAVALAAHRLGEDYLSYVGDERTPVSRADLDAIFRDYEMFDPETRARRIGVSEAHGNLVPAGFAILDVAMAVLGVGAIIPTGRGVAEGLLDERLS